MSFWRGGNSCPSPAWRRWESFDENTIIMTTVKGTLVVRGEDLHIEKLSLDGGDLRVEGVVDSLSYEDDSRERGGFFARLLR